MNSKQIQESPRDHHRDRTTAGFAKGESGRFDEDAARLEGIFNNMPEGVILADRQCHIHQMNLAVRAVIPWKAASK